MTDIAFHFGAPDKIAYACRLLRKVVRADNRVMVRVDSHHLSRLDLDLWSVSPTDFVTHCREGAESTISRYSSVLLCDSDNTSASATDRQILVNLSDTVPKGFDTFSTLIEVVSQDENDRAKARLRWKTYSSLGYSLIKHDLQLKGTH